jgi:plasmid stabilization system protein ParE
VTRTIVFRPEADEEARSARRWYEEQRSGLGIEFNDAIDRVLDRIASNPLSFPVIYNETRRAVIRRFPYGVYFRNQGDTVGSPP